MTLGATILVVDTALVWGVRFASRQTDTLVAAPVLSLEKIMERIWEFDGFNVILDRDICMGIDGLNRACQA